MLCTSCGREDPVRDVEFGMEIGLLLVRLNRQKKGRMCPACIRSTFWTYTLTTLVFGWWGIISFFVTPVVIVMNIISYRAVFLSPPYPTTDPPLALSSSLLSSLEPYRDEMFARLLKGEPMGQISEDIGRRTGASPAEVRAFYNRN
jgi:hypothetical protein